MLLKFQELIPRVYPTLCFYSAFDANKDIGAHAQAVGRCSMQGRITMETEIIMIKTQTQPTQQGMWENQEITLTTNAVNSN